MKASLLITLLILRSVMGRRFPDGFKFGVASSAFQIEGGWNADGKGESIWDRFVHDDPSRILNNSNADIACDSYHKYKEDAKMIADLGIKHYRFSLSWSRILPTGYINQVNRAGVKYYKNLITELLLRDIKPYVTLHHWDLPQALQDIGGWTNPLLIDIFENYAELVFRLFGNKVKYWLTFNEPEVICLYGYGFGLMAPGINNSGFDEYLCAHTILKAHARVYHLYDQKYRSTQNGKISIVSVSKWFEPATQSALNIEAAERKIQFEFGWIANPVYHPDGDYPAVMRERVDYRSRKEGFKSSRLPKFTADEVDYIKGTYDYFGLNCYTARMVEHQPEADVDGLPSWLKDVNVKLLEDSTWKTASTFWLKVVPWGIRKLLNWVDKTYNHPEIIIFENGYSDKGQLEDNSRIQYHKDYLNNVLDAIYLDKINVTGYFIWSLMDSFEWNAGYNDKFGLYKVDFNSSYRTRTMKKSAVFYKELIKNNTLL